MLATFVIGLREGLEAALIVGIVAAFLRQSGRADALRLVWLGISLTVAFCVGVAILLQVWHASLPQVQQEALETVVGFAAVGMVTYMIVWMRSHARGLRRDIEDAASTALARGSAIALVVMAVLAVLREGLETAVFLLAAFQASGEPILAGLGAVLGILVAVGLGYGIYRGGIRLDLRRFFRFTGAVLVFVAAGLVATSLHTAHAAGWINIGLEPALDLTWLVQPGTPLSALLTGVLGIPPQPTVVEIVGYFAYLIPMLLVVLWPVRPPRAAQVAASAALSLLLLGCAATPASPGASGAAAVTVVNVILTNAGCTPDRESAPAGPVQFDVLNDGGDRVAEVELIQDDRILGEKENLAPGLSGSFALSLEPGDYALYCPGAEVDQTPFTVTESTGGAPSASMSALLAEATAAYATYVRDQVDELVTATEAFTDAVIAGDQELAMDLYAPARLPYERIEPVAESFADLDPAIDGRIDDAPSPEAFTGFHRIEQALWETGSLDGMTPIAEQLLADVVRLQDLVADETYQPAQLANGSAELLDEIAASKITGEEERYSHIDLLDFQGNLDGSRQAFEYLRPALAEVDPALEATLVERFDALQASLDAYRSGDGFVPYTELTEAQTRELAQAVAATAEPMATVASVLLGS